MIRLLAGAALLVMPAAAMAQTAEPSSENDDHNCCVVSVPPKEVIVVTGSGQLPMVDADKTQGRTLITDIRPGLGNQSKTAFGTKPVWFNSAAPTGVQPIPPAKASRCADLGAMPRAARS